jgi:hypothetical protein
MYLRAINDTTNDFGNAGPGLIEKRSLRHEIGITILNSVSGFAINFFWRSILAHLMYL